MRGHQALPAGGLDRVAHLLGQPPEQLLLRRRELRRDVHHELHPQITAARPAPRARHDRGA